MVSQAVLSVLVILIPSGIICAGLSASSASSSNLSGTNGVTNAQFAQAQNTFPATGYGYNYGGFYPTYPIYPYGQINPGNPIQATPSLNSRNSFVDDASAPVTGQTTFNSQQYGSNPVVFPQNYGQFPNNLQQQQNAFFLQQQLQQQLFQQQLLQQQQQQQQQFNNPNLFHGVPNQAAPSLDSRIGDDDAPSSGVSGIQTSAFSSSSDVNGKKTHSGGTRTVVHKNGKTYVL